MLKKLSKTTNFILIGIVVGLFVGVSVRQALGDTTDVPGTVRADNLTVNTSGQYTNGLIVANGNALVSGNVGIGTATPTVKLDVVGDIKTSSRICIGATCVNEAQLQALLAGEVDPGENSAEDNATLCSSWHPGTTGAADVKPFVCSGKSIRSAAGEYVGSVTGDEFLPYLHKTEHDECFAMTALPSSLSIVSTPNGCKLSGALNYPGPQTFTWTVTNEFGTGTGDFTIVGYTPEKTLFFYSMCAGNGCKICPDAKVGEPYSCMLGVGTTGDWTGSHISFSLNWGKGGNPGDLGLWDDYNNEATPIIGPEPTEDDKTSRISGTPQKAGTYQLAFCAGNGTEAHAAFCMDHYAPFIVKPRDQTPSELNADIMSVVNDQNHPWTEATNAQSGTNLKTKMSENGWTLGDVSGATGYKMIDVINLLYPDADERRMVIITEIQKDIQTFDWSDANKHQSGINFRALMVERGWTADLVKFAFPFNMSGYQDPILIEILNTN